MRQNLAELLASAVSTTYGSYYGAVLSALTTRARATSAQLIRATPNLSSGDVRLALVAMVQQRIVNHYTDASGTTFYEPNWEHAYNFMYRIPTLCKLVEERYDTCVANVFNAVARAGVVCVNELLTEMCPAPPEDAKSKHENSNTNMVENGGSDTRAGQSAILSENELYGALNVLLAAGYLMRVNLRQFWPPHDREIEATNEVLRSDFPTGVSAKKEKDELKRQTMRLLRRWREEDENFESHGVNGFNSPSRKRTAHHGDSYLDADAELRNPKRQQLNGQSKTLVEHHRSWLSKHQDPLDPDLIIAVNFDRCAVGLRTNQFIQYCERHIHPMTAKVYGALLRVLEGSTSRCFDPLEERPENEREFFGPVYEKPKKIDSGLSEAVTTQQIANMLEADLDLTAGLAPEPNDDVEPSVENANVVNGHASRHEDDDDPESARLRRIEQHLHVLVCDSRGLVRRKHREWFVPFHSTTQRIIESEIESCITHTLGTLPARMVRILKFYGHQELRHLASRAMVTEDQARTACQLLQQAGWIDVVELPRTARREVTKSLWLWCYDVLQARQKCLADCYFTMTRLSIRLQSERQKIESVITKSERSDVVGHEDKFLNNEEKVALAKFAKSTDLITRQMVRIDELVAVMRDFSAMEHPHKLWDLGWVDWQSPERDGLDDGTRALEEYVEGAEDESNNEDEDEGLN
ncbi:hypothetical protein, variant [Verruconis gallopava]|uniref:DNA-directed RNA polymerase III subunit RPC3 n=1 Tax=Verruconis gallopava TaxID=253628 RepID=A0A0D2ALI0_9PEZI|nr:uncharacterized protein PV09_08454 [Verruconis gallopava]XP_016209804.1 hypothetical protein, variant [Verruconis gallopava]KIV99933.1 hypothetical protein PV09_08454 [Verruconis gallopava]KIV99934.1 hypothetical protein, variant [Verruconis gallopava]